MDDVSPFATHKHSDGPALPIAVPEELCYAGTAGELAEESHDTKQNGITPYFARVQ